MGVDMSSIIYYGYESSPKHNRGEVLGTPPRSSYDLEHIDFLGYPVRFAHECPSGSIPPPDAAFLWYRLTHMVQ